jgi:hypothetical protein
VAYPSLSSQLCIGGVYVRLLLEGGDTSERGLGGSKVWVWVRVRVVVHTAISCARFNRTAVACVA